MNACPACGRRARRAWRFCGGCGTSLAHGRAVARSVRAEDVATRARLRAVMVVFVGSLAALLVVGSLVSEDEDAATWCLALAQLGVGAAALACLGWSRWRATLGRLPTWPGLALAVPTAAISFTVATVYVDWLNHVYGAQAAPEGLGVATVLGIVILAPVCEEWLCRGVMWVALAPIASRATTICLTASLFALLHGLNGSYLLEIPHRLVLGLLCGILRVRTGSIWPALLAHALHNGVAVAVEGG